MRVHRLHSIMLLFAAAALSLGLAGSAWPETAQEALKAMRDTAAKARFAGKQVTVLHTPEGLWTSERVVAADGKGRFRIEYLSPPELSGELMCYDGKVFQHMIPKLREIRRGKRPQNGIFPRLFELLGAIKAQKARLALAGNERVAGRLARVVKAAAPGARHPKHAIWIDAQTHVPLKVEEYGRAGELVSQTRFAEIDFHPQFPVGHFGIAPRPGFRVVDSDAEVMQRWRGVGEAAKRLGFKPILPGELPPGLVARGWDVIDLPELKMKALALRIGGEHAISVVEANERVLRERTGRKFDAVMRELGKGALVWADRGVVIVLRSDAPPELLERLRRGLK